MRLSKALLVVLCLAGCTAGRDFPAPQPERLILGATTEQEILAVYGPPRQKIQSRTTGGDAAVVKTAFDLVPVAGVFDLWNYAYAAMGGNGTDGGIAARSVSFHFFNEQLVAYAFLSNFDSDSTDFDDSKVGGLEQGTTTKADVIRMLGQPGGRSIYPTIQTAGDEKFTYLYSKTDRQTRQKMLKRLEVLFTANDRLREYRFSSDNGPAPTAPAPTTVVPVIIRTR